MARAFKADIFAANGFVVVSNNFDYALGVVKDSFYGETELFPRAFKEQKDLLVEDVEEIVEAAYLTAEMDRLFVVKSENYSAVVQNKLLKLLEEPPSGVKFCLLVSSKAALLPTVRSRLMECEIKSEKSNVSLDINLSKISAKEMFDTLKKCESMNKEEAKEYLYALLEVYKRSEKKKEPFKNSQKLEMFDTAFKLLNLNTPPRVVFAAILAKLTAK